MTWHFINVVLIGITFYTTTWRLHSTSVSCEIDFWASPQRRHLIIMRQQLSVSCLHTFRANQDHDWPAWLYMNDRVQCTYMTQTTTHFLLVIMRGDGYTRRHAYVHHIFLTYLRILPGNKSPQFNDSQRQQQRSTNNNSKSPAKRLKINQFTHLHKVNTTLHVSLAVAWRCIRAHD